MFHVNDYKTRRIRARWICSKALLSAILSLLLGVQGGKTAHADCSGQVCQSSTHTPSGNWDVGNGDCKTGTAEGAEPSTWNQEDCGDTSTYGWKDWSRTLVNVTHNASCVDTMGVSCQPCGFSPYQTGDCPLAPTTSVYKHRHRKEGPTGNVLYDHTWVTNTLIACACGFHGCIR